MSVSIPYRYSTTESKRLFRYHVPHVSIPYRYSTTNKSMFGEMTLPYGVNPL